MAHLRNFFAAAALTFVLAGATLADDGIIYGGFMPTPTPTPVVKTNITSGEISLAPGAPSSDEVTATDIAIESALRVLAEMLLLY
jgi:hypothetical protein